MAKVFITGGTGYMRSRLIAELQARGHKVRALVRSGSEAMVPPVRAVEVALIRQAAVS